MPKLVIDNREVEVAPGTKVIDAAEKVGVMIPRFCYHPSLGAVGACRVCAVKFEEGPVSGIDMSCMVDARDGMRVSTADPEAVEFRKYVIECLMINHPHDCPVCDEGGHCLLQDLTVSGGHSRRRFRGKKRTYENQYLGPLVQHEMNRCIQCYRCSRYYQEITGYKDLGSLGIAGRVYFGRFREGTLESPFSGNLIDICPTGVYTDKPSRYTGRRWDFQRTPGICIHCGLGCNLTVCARYREIVRLEALLNEEVNGSFICDRGRYGFYYTNRSTRPWKGRADGKPVSPNEAIGVASRKLKEIQAAHGPSSVAVAGSDRSSLQTLCSLNYLCSANGWRKPVFWQKSLADSVKTAVSSLTPELAVSMEKVAGADAIFVIGADVLNEAPALTLSLRRAKRSGAGVMAVDPRPLDWPLEVEHLPLQSAELENFLGRLLSKLGGNSGTGDENKGSDEKADHFMTRLVQMLGESKRPVIVCGAEIVAPKTVARAKDIAKFLYEQKKEAGLFFLVPRANSYGAAILDDENRSVDDLLKDVEEGKVKALVLVESDIWETFPDRLFLDHALSRLELLVVADCIDSEPYRRADIQIPLQSVFDSGGMFVNQEGRVQVSAPACTGGLPIAVTGWGGHPPRIIREEAPGKNRPPAWRALWELADRNPPDSADLSPEWMAETFPVLRHLSDAKPGVTRLFSEGGIPAMEEEERESPAEGEFELLATASVFGDEPLSRYSECLKPFERFLLWMAPETAEHFGVSDGDEIGLELKDESLTLTSRISENMANGVLVLPRQGSLYWQQFDRSKKLYIRKDGIRLKKRV